MSPHFPSHVQRATGILTRLHRQKLCEKFVLSYSMEREALKK